EDGDEDDEDKKRRHKSDESTVEGDSYAPAPDECDDEDGGDADDDTCEADGQPKSGADPDRNKHGKPDERDDEDGGDDCKEHPVFDENPGHCGDEPGLDPCEEHPVKDENPGNCGDGDEGGNDDKPGHKGRD